MQILKTLQQLVASGMTQAEIGAEVNRDQSTISDMINHGIGLKNPSYELVTNLKKLAARKLKQTTKPKNPL